MKNNGSEIEKSNVISINDNNFILKLYNDSIIYIKEELKNFDPRMVYIEIKENVLFKIFLSKSYDGINWSELKSQDQLIEEFEKLLKDSNMGNLSQKELIEQNLIGEKVFLSIWCKQYKEIDDIKDIPGTIYQKKNIDERIPKLYISDICYREQLEPPYKPEPIFEINPKEIIAESVGLTKIIKIVSNLYWFCRTTSNWITLDKISGKGNDTINLIISKNIEKTERYGSIIFSSPNYDREIEISIIQNRADSDPFIEITENVKNITNEFQSFNFNIISNSEWVIRNTDSWLKISPKKGNKNLEILCVAEKNILNEKRIGKIIVETLDKKISKTLIINQDQYIFIPYSGGGTGAKISPYKLGIPEDLHYFLTTKGHDSGDNPKVYFELYQDIDMTGYYFKINETITFYGILNGNGYTISNFAGERGLFEQTQNSIIYNLKINVSIDSVGLNYMGNKAALIGKAINSTISNCSVSGTIKWDRMNCSSLVCDLTDSNINNCYSTIDFESFGNTYKSLGGCVNMLNGINVLVNCFWFGTLKYHDIIPQKVNPIVSTINGEVSNNYLKSLYYPKDFISTDNYSNEFIPITIQELNLPPIISKLNFYEDILFTKNVLLFEAPFIRGDIFPVIRKLKIHDIIYDGTGRIHENIYLNPLVYENNLTEPPIDPGFTNKLFDFDLSNNSKDIRVQTIYDLINQFPKWNFYDNQQITIKRWLDQCNSLAESYGHTCIYFKTTPVEVSHTLAVNVVRNVTSIKKLHIMFPNNELPQDRNTFTDWDLALQDDFICHIIVDKFEQAFGKNSIPEQRDYLYLPIINKIFRVTSMQVKNGFMGKVGWWEVFLAKYEEDECVVIEDDLKKAMGGFPEINEAMDSVEQNYENLKLQNNKELEPLLNEIELFKTSTIYDVEKIDRLNIDEKKKATQNFTDKLNDSTTYISAKETDAIKEFISKRLNIISVNPDSNIYPVTMYNCTEIPKRTIAQTYNIADFIKVNKKSNIINTCFDFNFNYVLFQKFTGEIFDLVSNNENIFLTIEQNRKKLSLILHNFQKTIDINFVLTEKNFYQICLNYKKEIQPNKNQISIKIFSVIDKQKKLEYQNTYIIDIINKITNTPIDKIYLYGGQFFTNDIELNIEDKNIIMDNANPVVQMNKFSL